MLFHPAAQLLLWTAGVVLLQSLQGNLLTFSVLVLVAAGIALARQRTLRLVRRARWLLVALIVVFSWSVPGRLVWPAIDWVSPTVEGLTLAIDHATRLIGLLAMVAILLEKSTRDGLLGGLYLLLRPLAIAGIDRSRAAIRLELVFRYAEQNVPRGQWREWLRSSSDAEPERPVTVPVQSFRLVDVTAITLVVAAGLWISFW